LAQNLIDKLKSIGFKEYEAKVFLVLLKGKPMSASEIAKESGVIRNSIYDVLKTFVDKGYCNEIETNTILKYQIIDPQVILDKLIGDYNTRHKSTVAALKDTFSELQVLYKTDVERAELYETNIQLLRGFNKHRAAKHVDIFKNSDSEVLGMFKLKGLVTEEVNDISRRFIENGGVLKSIYHISLDFKIMKEGIPQKASNDDLIRLCEFFESQGEQIRLSEMNIPNITVFDRNIVFINLVDKNIPKNKQADIIVQNKDFAENMSDLFEYYWQNSLSINDFKNKIRKN
jgi:sugar-specific transcriptional regulator TrmB